MTGNAPSWGDARAQILADIAHRLNKPVRDLEPWVDYDPTMVDEEAMHRSRGHYAYRWDGD